MAKRPPNPIPRLGWLPVVAVLFTGGRNPSDPPLDPGPLGPDECLYAEDPTRDGYRVQCEGEFHIRIDFKLLRKDCVEAISEEFCSQVHPFGPSHDTYQAPQVVACCGEAWDPVKHLDVYQKNCMQDLVAQACASIPERLQKAIEAGDLKTELGDFTDKATNLQKYVESHLAECAVALYDGNANAPDPGRLVSQWELPNVLGKDGWWPAKNLVVYVEAGTRVVDVHRPANRADWIECHGARAL